jgi:hypothetical protein
VFSPSRAVGSYEVRRAYTKNAGTEKISIIWASSHVDIKKEDHTTSKEEEESDVRSL